MKYLVAFLLLASTVVAGELNITRVPGTFSGVGGEFSVTPLDGLDFISGVPALNVASFQTFCLEKSETIGNGQYTYEINTGSVLGGVSGQTEPGFDPLSAETAWMYRAFVRGDLVGYDYGAGREASAGALQQAIWYSEGETLDLGMGAAFYQQAIYAQPTGLGGVRVLNLFQGDTHRQDQIFMHAPEPSTMILCGLALCSVSLWRKR